MSDKKAEFEIRVKTQGAQQVDQLEQSLNQTAQSAKNLGAKAEGGAAGLAKADQSAKGFTSTSGKLKDGLDSVSVQLAKAKDQLLAFAGIQGLASSVKDVSMLADAWKNMGSRLQLALGAQADINKEMSAVVGVAQATYSSLANTADLYGKLAIAGKELGRSNQDALALTQTINQAVQLSGASAQASDAAMTQLIQGLQSGVLRGEEFNSMMEQSPRLARALADGLNVPLGQLRSLAEAGKLTSSEVIRALTNQSEVIGREFGSLPVTIGRSVQNLQTEWQKFVASMDASSGASGAVAQGIQGLTRHLDDLARIGAASGAALTATLAVQAVAALRSAAAQMAATGGVAKLLAVDLARLGRPVQIAIAVTGFEVGYQIGEMLRENSALARQFGVGVVGFFELLFNDLRLLKEAAQAVFTSDTVSAAFDRYKQRNIEIGQSLKDMFTDAEKAPSAIAQAADKAAGSTQDLGTAAENTAKAMAYAGAAGAQGLGQAGAAAQTARQALEGLAQQVNTRPAADNGLTQISTDLRAAALRGEDLAKLLREKLPEAISKLSGVELVKFRADFVAAMDAAKRALQDAINTKKPQAEIDALRAKTDAFVSAMRTGLGLVAEQAAKNLGVDLVAASLKTSKAFEDARSNLNVLIRLMPELKAAGIDAAQVVAEAMGKMINGAKNKAEIDAVVQQVNVLRKSLGDKLADGLLDQAKQKSLELKNAMEDVTPGINSVREAMRLLGVTSDQTFKDTAEKSKAAYDAMLASGKASTRELSDGFKKAAEDAIAANKGVAPAWVNAQAAARGYTVEADAAGKATLRASADGKQAVSALGDQWRMTAEQVKANEEAIDRLMMKYTLSADYTERQLTLLEKENALLERREALENKRLNRDKEGFSVDPKTGQRVNMQIDSQRSVYEGAKAQGLSEADALKIAQRFISESGEKMGWNDGGRLGAMKGENWGTALQKAINELVLQNAARSEEDKQAKRPAPEPAPSPAPQPPPALPPTSSPEPAQQRGGSSAMGVNLTINVAAGADLGSRAQIEQLARQLMPAMESLRSKGVR